VSTILANSAPTNSDSASSSGSSITDSHEHAHHGLEWGNDSDAESDYSGDSWSDEGDYTGLSDSEGTSQSTGEASTLSTVSIELKEYDNYYKNDNDDAFYELLTAEDFDDAGDYEAGVTGAATDFNGIAGISW